MSILARTLENITNIAIKCENIESAPASHMLNSWNSDS